MSMVRKIDELGRVVLPMEFRKQLNVGTKCDMRMEVKDGSIILTPNECVCFGCGAIIPPKTKYNLCEACVTAIKNDQRLGGDDNA